MPDHNSPEADFTVIVDSGATVNIVRNENILHEIKKSDSKIAIAGLRDGTDEDTVCNVVGKLLLGGVHIPCYLDPSVNHNILSQTRLLEIVSKAGGSMKWINNVNNNSIHLKLPGFDTIVFGAFANGLYGYNIKWNLSENRMPANSVEQRVLLTQIYDLLHEKDKSIVWEVRKAKRNLGSISDTALINALYSGAIKSDKISPKHVRLATAACGMDPVECKARNPRMKKIDHKDKSTDLTLNHRVLTLEVQELFADVMYVENAAFLVSVSSPLGRVQIDHLPKGRSTTGEEVAQAIVTVSKQYATKGYVIEKAYFDGQTRCKVLSSVATIVPPNTHVCPAERMIRTIKEQLRALVMANPDLKFIGNLTLHAIYAAQLYINIRISKNTPNAPSPHQQWGLRHIDLERDFLCSFGMCVHVSKGKSSDIGYNKVTQPRTEEAMYLYPMIDEHHSHKVVLLGSNTVVIRTQFTVATMDNEFPDRVNKWAVKGPESMDITLLEKAGVQIWNETSTDGDEYEPIALLHREIGQDGQVPMVDKVGGVGSSTPVPDESDSITDMNVVDSTDTPVSSSDTNVIVSADDITNPSQTNIERTIESTNEILEDGRSPIRNDDGLNDLNSDTPHGQEFRELVVNKSQKRDANAMDIENSGSIQLADLDGETDHLEVGSLPLDRLTASTVQNQIVSKSGMDPTGNELRRSARKRTVNVRHALTTILAKQAPYGVSGSSSIQSKSWIVGVDAGMTIHSNLQPAGITRPHRDVYENEHRGELLGTGNTILSTDTIYTRDPLDREEALVSTKNVVSDKGEKPKVTYTIAKTAKAAAQIEDPLDREEALIAIENELKNVYETHKALKPVEKTNGVKALPSSIFVDRKYVDGRYLKTKARLVAGGHRQNKDEFLDIVTSTVQHVSVMIIVAIAVFEKRKLWTLDVVAAYLNTDMETTQGDQMYITIQKELADIFVKLYPEYKHLRRTKTGGLYMQVNKALYGCIQSAHLWQNQLKAILNDLGLDANPYDECLMTSGTGPGSVMIAYHSDDLIMSCSNEKIGDAFVKEFGLRIKIKSHKGNEINYLGLHISITPDSALINQIPYIKSITNDIDGIEETLPSDKMFLIYEGDEPLTHDKYVEYRKRTAQLLFIGRMSRATLSRTISNLCSNAIAPTERHWRALIHTLKYLKYTVNLKLELKCTSMDLEVWVDASFASNKDGKSHTGCIIKLGGAMIWWKSSKQKIVTKSSTEAEIVGLSDTLSMVVWLDRLLESLGYRGNIPTVYQDNLGSIHITSTGLTNNERTRHINVRDLWTNELKEHKRFTLKYCPTERMLSDGLTKTLTRDKTKELEKMIGMVLEAQGFEY